jgi:Na+/proline symporter
MLAARSEGHAQGATFLFNACHYALRPWPWIVVALASLVVFPDLQSLRTAFPNVDPRVVGHDLAYPAMLTFLPAGILGVVVASLAAAFMSTISTHLNWGSSYLVNDLYRRFVAPDSSERRLVLVGRLCTVVLMFAAGAVSLLLSNALQAFQILLQIGAGTGLLFLLRWFWRRINAACELVAMLVSFAVAAFFQFVETDLLEWERLVAGVAITTAAWVLTAFVTRPTDEATLRRFFERTRPGGPALRAGVACMVLGSVAIYAALFATGLWLYGRGLAAAGLTGVGVVAALGVLKLWPRLAPAP